MAERRNASKGRSRGSGGGSDKKVYTSQCFIGGEVRRIGVDDDSAWVLVDVGKASKWLMCSVYKSRELCDRLDKYSEGDHILLVGYVRAYSRKDESGEFERESKMSVQVTEIRSEDPKHDETRKNAEESFKGASDDDIPF